MRRHVHDLLPCLLCLLLLFTGGRAGAGTTQSFGEVLTSHLEQGPARTLGLRAHGRNADEIDTLLRGMYQANGFIPYWLDNGLPSGRARAVKSVIDDALSHGLDPESYFASAINRYWQSSDIADRVRLDILLSLGMMRYVADQREGRIEPRELDPKLFASAHNVEVDWQPLWREAFGAIDMRKFLEDQAPPFPQYHALKAHLAEYRIVAALGGWTQVPSGEALRPGMEDSRLPILIERLTASGDLTNKIDKTARYTENLIPAVKRFQQRHGLQPDGIIGDRTLKALNVPVTKRIEQLILNMERYRWLDRSIITERSVVVNIAGFTAAAASGPDRFDLVMAAVVGREYHQTPVFSDIITYVEFNPFWNVPLSIARNELLPKLKRDPHNLRKQGMRLFAGEYGGRELDSTAINWSKVSPSTMNRYRIRQDPGPKNSLGTLKIMFPNQYSVYLHDTPARDLFSRDSRAFSHGCIRLEKPVAMASWVLGGEASGWSETEIRGVIAEGKRRVINLRKPLPIHILYRTAVVETGDNTLYFYDDIYGRDTVLATALHTAAE